MSDQQLIEKIRSAVQKSLDMGFSLMICEPHGKAPYSKYSPHGCNSSTRVPDILFQPWNEGEEANYGVSCGPSNLTVLDVDHGIKSMEEFELWRMKNNIPETFTVLSGRDGEELGLHLYFSGSIPTTGFNIGGVTGELKGKGGYVVGPGSIHPSGKEYKIIRNRAVVPLPEGLAALSSDKKKLEFTPKADGGSLIPAGSRWIHLESKAGTFRNAGLDEEGIYNALKNFAANNCEDGENYPDEKIKEIAHAAYNKFDAMEAAPIVFTGEKKIDTSIPELPDEAIDGDWIGELSRLVTDGTFIPPAFSRIHIKAILGSSIDGMVGFYKHKDLHMRQIGINIAKPQSGKGESWKRLGEAALANYLSKTHVHIIKGESLGSGEYMIANLQDSGYDNSTVLLYYDELSVMLTKGNNQGSTLLTRMCQLYESKKCSTGSIKNSGAELNNLSMSIAGGIPPTEWENLSGKGAGGSGFLSRCVLAQTEKPKKSIDWPDMDTVSINAVTMKMFMRWQEIYSTYSEQNDYTKHPENKEKGWRWIVEESPEVHELRATFMEYLNERAAYYSENDLPDYTERLDDHFKRDFMFRAIFSDDGILTEEKMKRSIAWAKHELLLREELWPIDRGNLVTRMEATVIRAFRRHQFLTKSEAQKYCNVTRPETGGIGTFNQAWTNLLKGDVLIVVGKTTRHTDKFGLREGF